MKISNATNGYGLFCGKTFSAGFWISSFCFAFVFGLSDFLARHFFYFDLNIHGRQYED